MNDERPNDRTTFPLLFESTLCYTLRGHKLSLDRVAEPFVIPVQLHCIHFVQFVNNVHIVFCGLRWSIMPRKPSRPKVKGSLLGGEKKDTKDKETEWFNPSEAISYLGISRATLYKLMDEGILPFYTIRGIRKRRLKKENLDALLEKGVPGSTSNDEKDD
jgi:excisionase family DNA binding protein